MARPNLRSLSYASHITNLIYIKNISTGNWAMTSPDVTPINMNVVNKMLVAGTIETLRAILYHDPPPADMLYTERVIHLFNKAKEQLVEYGKDVEHIPDYKLSSKRKTRKPPSSSTSTLPPPPPPPQSSPPHPSSTPTPPPRRGSREDRVLDAIANLSLEHQKFATYTHQCMTQLHEENVYLAKKMDDQFHYLDASLSLLPNPPLPMDGLPFIWPPSAYYTVFPSSTRPEDVPGSSGAGPSGAGAEDVAGDVAGHGADGAAGADGAGTSSFVDASGDIAME